MKSFSFFRDEKDKDWKESLKDGALFFEKNKQLILLFLLGLAAFPVLFFLSVSFKKASTNFFNATGIKFSTENVNQNLSTKMANLCAQDVKRCEDGSYVKRAGRKCNFAPCPSKTAPGNTGKNPSEKVCAQDVKLCSDGSSVSRVGKNCEFAPCPMVKAR